MHRKSSSSYNNNNSKNRLGKFSSSLGIDDNNIISSSYGDNSTTIKKWLSSIISCGSNAFGQIYQSDVMCSTPQVTLLPNCSHESDENILLPITHIAVGTNITIACVEKKKIYIWGSGLGSQLRVPTLLKFPEKIIVEQLSCGESHAALVSKIGKVYTWGNGEHGALGHGNKQSQSLPKVVNALINLRCISVSCGPFHTAFIAGEENDISYVRIPSLSTSSSSSHQSKTLSLYRQDSSNNNENDNNNENNYENNNESMMNHNVLICASLYTCGLGKAGQLGHGQSIAMMRTPQIVNWFTDNGYKVAQVSCGMHHTVTLCVPIHAIRVFTTNIFTFGWGEHGRLGLGNEEGALFPTMVEFSEPFHAIHISAGEQHTIATSGRVGGCYAWGNNEFGQCGIGIQSTNDMILSPTKVALPEGIRAMKVFGGGRHTAALSADNQILFWGWGEEGQLGNGSEKDSILPKPCRIPTIMGIQPSSMNTIDIGLGMSHSVILVQNLDYTPIVREKPKVQIKPQQVEQIKIEPEPQPEPEPEPQKLLLNDIVNEIPIENLEIIPPDPPKELIIIERVPITPIDIVKKEAIMVVHEVQEPPPVITPVPIRSLKDILNAREERREGKITELVSVLEPYIPPSSSPSFSSLPTKPKSPEITITNENETNKVHVNLKESHNSNETEEEVTNNSDNHETNEQGNQPKRRGSGNANMQQYFYREGQDLSQCYVANSAKRAEIRKIKKASQQYSDAKPTDKTNKNTNRINK